MLMSCLSLFWFFAFKSHRKKLPFRTMLMSIGVCNLTSRWDPIVAAEVFKSHSFFGTKCLQASPHSPPASCYTSTPPPRWNYTTSTFLAFQKLTDCCLGSQTSLLPAGISKRSPYSCPPPTSILHILLLTAVPAHEPASTFHTQPKKKKKENMEGKKTTWKRNIFEVFWMAIHYLIATFLLHFCPSLLKI